MTKTRRTMRLAAVFFLAGVILPRAGTPARQVSENYEEIKAKAEAVFAEGSFAKARDLYASAAIGSLTPEDKRWVEFRLLDTNWRAEEKNPNRRSDPGAKPDVQLLKFIASYPRNEDADLAWAEAQESLGDYYWVHDNAKNWKGAWPCYQAAMGWWAGSYDLDQARGRYLVLAWKATLRHDMGGKPFTVSSNDVPAYREMLEDALKLATLEADQAFLSYRLVAFLVPGSTQVDRKKILRTFEKALTSGKSSAWYAQTLLAYAQWSEGLSSQQALELGDGSPSGCAKALKLYKRIVSEFDPGETPGLVEADAKVKNLGQPVLSVSVANYFLPGSVVPVVLGYRNVQRVDFSLHSVDLTRIPSLPMPKTTTKAWIESLSLDKLPKVKTWSRDTSSTPGCDGAVATIELDEKLPQGAYILEARSGEEHDRELILITEMALLLKVFGEGGVVYACDAIKGSPVPGARVKLWVSTPSSTQEIDLITDKDGLAVFQCKGKSVEADLWATASLGPKQAIASALAHNDCDPGDRWEVYAFTDRPLFRPADTVQWKVVARQLRGHLYETPSGQSLGYEIYGPQHTKVKDGTFRLNTFGSAWGSFEIPANWSLGEYSIAIVDDQGHGVAQAEFFRLEEFKLPEFSVAVTVPEEGEKKKIFKPGEKVEVTLQAEYYSGGPVPDAEVEVVVTQQPFQLPWPAGDDLAAWDLEYGGYRGQIFKRESRKTDAAGRLLYTFDPDPDPTWDMAYKIEVTVTDASRRQVSGAAVVKVPLQPFFVKLESDRNIYRASETVHLSASSTDVYGQPVSVRGTLKVFREVREEVWQDPEGKEFKGEALAKERRRFPKWPPPQGREKKGWALKSFSFVPKEILSKPMEIGDGGKARFDYSPAGDGMYRFEWTGGEGAKSLRKAGTAARVCSGGGEGLELPSDHIEVWPEHEKAVPGEKFRALVIAPKPNRWALVTLEGGGGLRPRLVHLLGRIQIVEVDVAEEDAPNAILHADSMAELKHEMDTAKITVPSKRHDLIIEVTPDHKEVLPRAEGTIQVRTLDWKGRPVSAEVSLGVADASVYAFQKDYARDPATVFTGGERESCATTATSMENLPYAKISRSKEGTTIAALSGPPVSGVRVTGIIPGAYGGTGTLNGRVVDAQGQAIPGAEVVVTSKYLQGPRATVTNLDGDFSIPYLPQAVDFKMVAEAQGYGKVVQAGIIIQSGSVTTLTVTLAGTTEMTVTASAPVVRMMDTKVATTLTQEELQTLPLNRAYQNVLYLAPSAASAGIAGTENARSVSLVVRHDFRSTAFWKPDILTGQDGLATISMRYPDDLTTWRATARAATSGDAFGEAQANARTNQPFLLRVEAPRFLVVGDEATLSALVENRTGKPLSVTCDLVAPGVKILNNSSNSAPMDIPSGGQARMDWSVSAEKPGDVPLKMVAIAGAFSDAVERPFTIREHGIEIVEAKSGKVAGDKATFSILLPEGRRAGSTRMTVRLAPGLAVALLDALPYLVGYPYGCTEQTMSRFLPCVITAKSMKDLHLDTPAALSRMFHSEGAGPDRRASGEDPGEMKKLDDMVKRGLERLYRFHHSDGGWGWMEADASDRFMSAYVVWGLSLAREVGVKVDEKILNEGSEYLLRQIEGAKSDLSLQAWMYHAFSVYEATKEDKDNFAEAQSAFANLWANRTKLEDYPLALFVISLRNLGFEKEARELAQDLSQRVLVEGTRERVSGESKTKAWKGKYPESAHWGRDGSWWHWTQGTTEKTAFALRALAALDPGHPLLEPALTWLLSRRVGVQWSNTRDTAIAVLALNDCIAAMSEESDARECEVAVNGHALGTLRIFPDGSSPKAGTLEVPPEILRSGKNQVTLTRVSGHGPFYFAAEARFFGIEEPLRATGSDLTINRRYLDITPRPTLLKGHAVRRQELASGSSVSSGDRVECVLTVEAKKPLEYLIFEDMKPAGMESVELKSGGTVTVRELLQAAPVATQGGAKYAGRTLNATREVRDQKVTFFLSSLPAGSWEIRYELRAEVPGTYNTMPSIGQAMYIPGIRCNGEEVIIQISDRAGKTEAH